MKKRWKRNIPLIISILLAIIAFIFGYYADFFNYSEHASLSSVPAFFLSVVILLIGQIISIQFEVDKVSDESGMVCETVKNYLQITKVGTPKSSWNYIIDKLSELEYVQNTSFNFGDELEQTKERLYNDVNYQKSFKEISMYIRKGLHWKDIGDSTAVERFRHLHSLISENTSGSYSYRLISQSEPQIGFILLTYKDGTKEVIFNWDFRDIPQDPVVLLSRDEEIFNMFAAQYRGLWRVGTEHYDTMDTKSTS